MVLTDREWFSLMSGLILGRHIKQPSNNKVDTVVSVNKKPRRVSKFATIGITAGKRKADSREYSTVRIPIMCTGVNIGVGAFVAKLQWEPYLRYTGVDFGDFGSNINIDNSKAINNNELLVLGQNSINMEEKDFVLFWVNFEVINVPEFIDRVYINCIKTTGTTMTDCSLLTYQDSNLFYITPIEVNRGYVYFDSNDREIENPPKIELSGPTNFPIGSSGGDSGGGTAPIGGTTVGSFVLSGFLGGPGGSGAWVVISIWQGGVVVGQERFWANSGNFSLSGRIPISTSNPGYGDIKISIEVEPEEDDDTPYYILIPAGGFSIAFTTEVSEGDETFPKRPQIIMYLDRCEIVDFHDILLYSNEPVDLDDNMEEVYIEGIYEGDIINVDISNRDTKDILEILDMISVEIETPPIPVDMDGIEDIINIEDILEDTIIPVNILNKDNIEEIGIMEINDVEIFTPPIPIDADGVEDEINIVEINNNEVIEVNITEIPTIDTQGIEDIVDIDFN